MSADSPIRQRLRIIIDSVYGAKAVRGAYIYLACLWVPALFLALILWGLTPWSWPAQADGQAPSLAPISCEAVFDASLGLPFGGGGGDNSASGQSKAGGARPGCIRSLPRATREQFDRVEGTIAYLKTGGSTPAPLNLPEDSPLRSWVNSNICRLGGVDGAERGALAWQVNQDVGQCGDLARRGAQFPLSIWFGWWPGTLATPLILLLLFFFLARHSLRLRSTRRAYRRLFGSEHKAD